MYTPDKYRQLQQIAPHAQEKLFPMGTDKLLSVVYVGERVLIQPSVTHMSQMEQAQEHLNVQ